VVERPVFPSEVDLEALRSSLGSLDDRSTPAAVVIGELADAVERALVSTSPTGANGRLPLLVLLGEDYGQVQDDHDVQGRHVRYGSDSWRTAV
jgi:hypothetical protein